MSSFCGQKPLQDRIPVPRSGSISSYFMKEFLDHFGLCAAGVIGCCGVESICWGYHTFTFHFTRMSPEQYAVFSLVTKTRLISARNSKSFSIGVI